MNSEGEDRTTKPDAGCEHSKASFFRSPTVVFERSMLRRTRLFSVRYSKDLIILSVIVADRVLGEDESESAMLNVLCSPSVSVVVLLLDREICSLGASAAQLHN